MWNSEPKAVSVSLGASVIVTILSDIELDLESRWRLYSVCLKALTGPY